MMTDEMLTKLAVNERSLSAALITFGGRCCCCSGGGGIGGSSAMLDLWLELFMSYTNIYILMKNRLGLKRKRERDRKNGGSGCCGGFAIGIDALLHSSMIRSPLWLLFPLLFAVHSI